MMEFVDIFNFLGREWVNGFSMGMAATSAAHAAVSYYRHRAWLRGWNMAEQIERKGERPSMGMRDTLALKGQVRVGFGDFAIRSLAVHNAEQDHKEAIAMIHLSHAKADELHAEIQKVFALGPIDGVDVDDKFLIGDEWQYGDIEAPPADANVKLAIQGHVMATYRVMAAIKRAGWDVRLSRRVLKGSWPTGEGQEPVSMQV